ncbi:unnamed protein product [Adineta steineri]|uniref:Uncharacterized protein n=1 Tax=Adineta steineri TaxID=433720 RepID=A0A819GX43_9BILA|nr:unnamed protein product [Adineta steineri]
MSLDFSYSSHLPAYQQATFIDGYINILLLKEAGNLDDLESTWFGSSTCSVVSETTTTAMGINAMAGLFLTFLIITILSLLLFLWNKIYATRYKLFRLFDRNK